MKSAIVSAFIAFGEAFKKQFNQNQYDRAVKVVEKNGCKVVEPKPVKAEK